MTAVKIVHDELEFPLFAIDVAKRVNLSRSYFYQCFKEIVGYSFNEYLRKVRIDKAREYLEQTSGQLSGLPSKPDTRMRNTSAELFESRQACCRANIDSSIRRGKH